MTRFILTLCALGIASIGYAADKPFGERSIMSNSSVAERTAKAGEVCVAGEDCAGAAAAKADPAEQLAVAEDAGPRGGEEVYTTYCSACHGSGAAGAPKVTDGAAWQARLKQRGSEEALWKSGWKGINAMPAKGMCMDCTEEEFASSVAFMLKQSTQ